jgi:diguanylate cyclase (GGDEF)-like protein
MLLDGIRGSGSDALVDLALLSPAGDADGDTVLWASPGAQGQTYTELASWPVAKMVNAPGRNLLLVGRPAEALVASLGPWRPWAIAGTVALVTILLAALTWKWIDARRLRTLAQDLGRASGRLRFLAERDPLTSLPHREGLRKWYESVRGADPGAGVVLLFVDLDAFKDINTVWGHPTGDAILTQTAARLAEAFIGEHSIAVRLGGDEFVVAAAFPDGDAAEQVERMGRRVQDVVHQPMSVAGREFLLTASIGAAVVPDDADALETLLARADLAVRRAKHESRGRCRRYQPEMSQRAAARERIVAALRRDARHPDEHFRLVYQPQVDMRSGRVVGLEALIRWNDAAEGWGSPEEFIPLAEQYGLMPTLGDWVLTRAGAQYTGWLDAGLDIGRASVNVTAQQLSAGGFPEHLDEILTRSPALRGHLEIEITESTAMGAVGLGLLHQVRDAGVGIAIDDFGTGFSSLARLTEVPSQRVKIDRRFIARLTASQEALEVVRAIVHMAEALQLGTVAEGVETPEQAAILVREGVDVAQGFLYSRPLSQAQTGAVLRYGLERWRESPAESAPTLRL